MGKTIRFGKNGLIALKKKLNEIVVGTDGVSHNNVVTLWHGTDIPGILGILKSGVICAENGTQHGETTGMNWFSNEKTFNFSRGVVFSIRIPSDVFEAKFKHMNKGEVTTKDKKLDIADCDLKIEHFCGFNRKQLNKYYNSLVERGERYPIETIRDNIFYKWCEDSGNEDVFVRTSDQDFGLIMANILGEDAVRKEGFLDEGTIYEAAAEVDEYTIGMEEGGGPGLYAHAEEVDESIDFDDNDMSVNDEKILGKYNLKDLILSKNGKYVTLNKIVAKECGKGYGSKFMEELTRIADENGWVLTLTPDASFGASSVGRLKKFYKKFGFVPNKGKKTDFNTRESMIRRPLREEKSITEKNDVISLAVENYGTTSNLNQAGYILPDGRLLNFGSEGSRDTDHRNIEGIYKRNNIDIWSDEYRYNYVVDFMNHGAIRCCLNGGILDMTQEPTKEQYYVIRVFVRRAVDVDIDFTDNRGNTLHSVSYSDASPQQVVADIYRYFNEGIKPQGNVQYESKGNKKNIILSENQLKVIKENIEQEVESSEVDLSSFKKQGTLPPKIWKDEETLDSRIRLKLLDIADDFWEFVNLSWVEPKGIIMTGSLCNYNWSEFSDVDLHLIVDFDEIDEKTEFVKQYLDSKKNEWNNEHEGLKIKGYPVELYVQDVKDDVEAGGIYDLEENKWVRKPNPDKIKSIGLDKFSIKDKAAEIMTIIDDMHDALISTDDSYEIEEIGDDASLLWGKIKDMRKNGLGKNGESSPGNICYKTLRRTGYLDKLWKLRTMCYDRENSINESKEILNEYLDKDYVKPLYGYFKWADNASDRDKVEDLIYHCPYILGKYFEDVSGYYDDLDELIYKFDDDNDLVYDDDFINRVLDAFEKNNLLKRLLNNAYNYAYAEELPAWFTMELVRPVKNEWCIHFTSDAHNIAREGFTGGTPDIEDIAYTGAGQQKHYAGYDFAYLLNDRNVNLAKYGNEAVIFRASGVLLTHYGDNEDQVVFWGPSVKEIIPIKKDEYSYDWEIEGLNGQIFKTGTPSKLADWATDNLPQYRKQILAGKSGYRPYGFSRPSYYNESVKKYITSLKDNMINEEFNADGNTEHNPYKKRWEAEREALKNYISNYGVVMQSKEDNKNGKLYKCLYDKWISQIIGYNYCLCVQWDNVKLKPKSVVYIRALDKFTPNIKQVSFDNRGFDNQRGTYDDVGTY